MHKTLAVIVLVALLTMVGSVWAEGVIPSTLNGEHVVYADVAPALDLAPLTLKATAATKTIVIPASFEFSTLGGVAFPGATGGFSVSYLVAATEGGWAQFFIDAGGLFVESTPLAVFLGGSTSLTTSDNLGINSRVGLGWFVPVSAEGGKSGLFAYVRFPIGNVATKTTAF